MEKAKIRLSAAIALIISVLTGLIVTFFCLPKSAVFAEETTDGDSKYTTVTEDLENVNGGFDTSKYPQKDGDYSLQFLTVAVNKSNELLVYVYQPAALYNRKATSINIEFGQNGTKNYILEFVDSDTVFFKYKVKDFKIVYATQEQTIEVVSIFREFIKGVDKNASDESGNTILEVVYPIAQKITIKNGVVTACKDVEVITVLQKYVGFIRYDKSSYFAGLWGGGKSIDSHFVAFQTDHEIDTVLSARLSFCVQDYTDTTTEHTSPLHSTDKSSKSGTKESKIIDLNRGEVLKSADKSKTKYEYARVQSVSEFLANEDVVDGNNYGLFSTTQERLSTAAKNELKNKQFILRFYESDYKYTATIPHEHWKLPQCSISTTTLKYTRVSEVTLLTLEFKRNGITFKLNAVDNKQTGSKNPIDGSIDVKTPVDEWVKGWFDDVENSLKALLIFLSVTALIIMGIEVFKSIKGGSGSANININLSERSKKNGNKKK